MCLLCHIMMKGSDGRWAGRRERCRPRVVDEDEKRRKEPTIHGVWLLLGFLGFKLYLLEILAIEIVNNGGWEVVSGW